MAGREAASRVLACWPQLQGEESLGPPDTAPWRTDPKAQESLQWPKSACWALHTWGGPSKVRRDPEMPMERVPLPAQTRDTLPLSVTQLSPQVALHGHAGMVWC